MVKDITKGIELVSKDKLNNLIRDYQESGDEDILYEVIQQTYRFVVSRAKKFYKPDNHLLEYEDLVNAGVIGVLEAVKTFDVNKDYTFLTYADFYISRDIREIVRLHSSPAYVPKRSYTEINKMYTFLKELPDEESNTISSEKLSKELNIPLNNVKMYRTRGKSTIRLDQLIDNDKHDGKVSLDYFINNNEQGYVDIENNDLKDYLFNIMNKELTEKEQYVIVSKYGLDGGEPMTYDQMGRAKGYSLEWMRKLNKSALRKLKKIIKKEGYSIDILL